MACFKITAGNAGKVIIQLNFNWTWHLFAPSPFNRTTDKTAKYGWMEMDPGETGWGDVEWIGLDPVRGQW
jgi:hypothetical protein